MIYKIKNNNDIGLKTIIYNNSNYYLLQLLTLQLIKSIYRIKETNNI